MSIFQGMKYVFAAIILLSSITLRGQNTILWEVKSPNGVTSYLVGTMHQLGNSFVDSLRVVREKLLASELVVFESTGLYPGPIDTSILIRDENDEYKALRKKDIRILEEWSKDWNYPLTKLRVPEILAKLTQDYYTTHCGNVRPEDTRKHFDYYLEYIADHAGIQMLGLESDSMQLSVINAYYGSSTAMEIRKSISFWIQALQEPSDDPSLCEFAYQYRKLEIEYDLDLPCTDDVLMKQRNDRWMQTLPGLLENHHCFIAVGLGHLQGTCGLIQQLRELGFVVSPVQMRD